MPSKITQVKLSGTVASSAIDVYSANAVRGRVIAVQLVHSSGSDTLNVDITCAEPVAQKILDIDESATTDITVYPEVAVSDNTNTALDLSDAEGGNTAKYDKYCVFGRLRLEAAGTNGDVLTAYVLVEEY